LDFPDAPATAPGRIFSGTDLPIMIRYLRTNACGHARETKSIVMT
jgi:hypothetical protein